jgi:hypothetical protein
MRTFQGKCQWVILNSCDDCSTPFHWIYFPPWIHQITHNFDFSQMNEVTGTSLSWKHFKKSFIDKLKNDTDFIYELDLVWRFIRSKQRVNKCVPIILPTGYGTCINTVSIQQCDNGHEAIMKTNFQSCQTTL